MMIMYTFQIQYYDISKNKTFNVVFGTILKSNTTKSEPTISWVGSNTKQMYTLFIVGK